MNPLLDRANHLCIQQQHSNSTLKKAQTNTNGQLGDADQDLKAKQRDTTSSESAPPEQTTNLMGEDMSTIVHEVFKNDNEKSKNGMKHLNTSTKMDNDSSTNVISKTNSKALNAAKVCIQEENDQLSLKESSKEHQPIPLASEKSMFPSDQEQSCNVAGSCLLTGDESSRVNISDNGDNVNDNNNDEEYVKWDISFSGALLAETEDLLEKLERGDSNIVGNNNDVNNLHKVDSNGDIENEVKKKDHGDSLAYANSDHSSYKEKESSYSECTNSLADGPNDNENNQITDMDCIQERTYSFNVDTNSTTDIPQIETQTSQLHALTVSAQQLNAEADPVIKMEEEPLKPPSNIASLANVHVEETAAEAAQNSFTLDKPKSKARPRVTVKEFKGLVNKVHGQDTLTDDEFSRFAIKIEKNMTINPNDPVFIPSVLDDSLPLNPEELEITKAMINSKKSKCNKRATKTALKTKKDTTKDQSTDISLSVVQHSKESELSKEKSSTTSVSPAHLSLPFQRLESDSDGVLPNSEKASSLIGANKVQSVEADSNSNYMTEDTTRQNDLVNLDNSVALFSSDDDLFGDKELENNSSSSFAYNNQLLAVKSLEKSINDTNINDKPSGNESEIASFQDELIHALKDEILCNTVVKDLLQSQEQWNDNDNCVLFQGEDHSKAVQEDISACSSKAVYTNSTPITNEVKRPYQHGYHQVLGNLTPIKNMSSFVTSSPGSNQKKKTQHEFTHLKNKTNLGTSVSSNDSPISVNHYNPLLAETSNCSSTSPVIHRNNKNVDIDDDSKSPSQPHFQLHRVSGNKTPTRTVASFVSPSPTSSLKKRTQRGLTRLNNKGNTVSSNNPNATTFSVMNHNESENRLSPSDACQPNEKQGHIDLTERSLSSEEEKLSNSCKRNLDFSGLDCPNYIVANSNPVPTTFNKQTLSMHLEKTDAGASSFSKQTLPMNLEKLDSGESRSVQTKTLDISYSPIIKRSKKSSFKFAGSVEITDKESNINAETNISTTCQGVATITVISPKNKASGCDLVPVPATNNKTIAHGKHNPDDIKTNPSSTSASSSVSSIIYFHLSCS